MAFDLGVAIRIADAPSWPRAKVSAFMTSRDGGGSGAPFDSFNLGLHVGDDPSRVRAHRSALATHLGDGIDDRSVVQWLDQIHGARCVRADRHSVESCPAADAVWTTEADVALAIMTADCVPVLLRSRDNSLVAAAHAGWRGLAAGVLENLLAELPVASGELLAWVGPCISQANYEVAGEVHAALKGGAGVNFFQASRPGHWLLDLGGLAAARLRNEGVNAVQCSGLCTFAEQGRLYSHRRDGVTGRQVAVVMRRSGRVEDPRARP